MVRVKSPRGLREKAGSFSGRKDWTGKRGEAGKKVGGKNKLAVCVF